MSSFVVTKAQRVQLKARVALLGPSGSGKTLGALTLAKELAGENGKIIMFDTENGRGKHYADQFDYDYAEFNPPFSPERFVEAINFAKDAGYDVCIIDSATHEWKGPGGVLEIANTFPKGYPANWNHATPRHNAFIDAVVQAKTHLIMTVRGKDEYVIEENDRGKQQVRKVGVGGDQRGGFEYEMDFAFLLDQKTHKVQVMKTTLGLFENYFNELNEEVGKTIYDFCEGGSTVEEVSKDLNKKISDSAIELQDFISKHEAHFSEKQQDQMLEVINKTFDGSDINEMREHLAKLNKLITWAGEVAKQKNTKNAKAEGAA